MVFRESLTGVVICCTGIPVAERENCFRIATMHKGRYCRDLDDTVTHVIARSNDLSEKYKMAVERCIPVVHPQWLLEFSRSNRSSFEDFLILPFAGLTISVTGHSVEVRERIAQQISSGGGTFSADLSKNCTHLVADSSGSAKFRYAQQWNLSIVTERWITDCIARNGRLSEGSYEVKECANPAAGLFSGLKIAVVGAGAAAEDVKAVLVQNSATIVTPAEAQIILVDSNATSSLNLKSPPVSFDWVRECTLRKEVVPTDRYYRLQPRSPLKEQRSLLLSSRQQNQEQPQSMLSGTGQQIFAGLFFSLHESLASPSDVESLITRLGGSICNDPKATLVASYLCYQSHAKWSEKCVTDFFIVACAQEGTLLQPKSHLLFIPRTAPLAISPTKRRLCVGITGFQGYERHLIVRAIEIAGHSYSDRFSRRCHALLAVNPSDVGALKIEKAREWNVPVHPQSWIFSQLTCDGHDNSVSSSHMNSIEFDTHSVLGLPITPLLPRGENRLEVSLESPEFFRFAESLRSLSNAASGIENSLNKKVLALHEVFVFIDSRISNRENFASVARQLGALVVSSVSDARCTHLLTTETETREFRAAKSRGLAAVSPLWLLACRDSDTRFDEAGFPPGYNGNGLELQAVGSKRKTPSRSALSTVEQIDSLIVNSAKREPLSLSASRVPEPPPITETLDSDSRLHSDLADGNLPRVRYADADYEIAQRALLKKLRRASSTEESPVVETCQSIASSAPTFMLSSLGESQRVQFTRYALKNNIRVINANEWCDEATHLICGSLARSEKFLAACATGCWVLKGSFIDALLRTTVSPQQWTALLPDHEWATANQSDAAQSTRFWRLRKEKTSALPFSEFCVIIFVSAAKLGSFQRILRSGGAAVLQETQIADGVNYIFVESEQFLSMITPATRSFLAKKGRERVLVVKIDFVADFLLKQGSVDVRDYAIAL